MAPVCRQRLSHGAHQGSDRCVEAEAPAKINEIKNGKNPMWYIEKPFLYNLL